MKYFFIAVIVIAVIAMAIQVYFTISMSKIETHQYTVISKKGNMEIRKYNPSIFISYSEKGSMFEVQNNSFRNLAGYIFGGNASSEKIAMTAPVQMEEGENSSEMRFMIPSEYKMNQLPAPNSPKVLFNEESGFYAAVIRYGGFNSEKKFKNLKEQLKQFIKKKNLELAGEFIFLGYNPPFQWFNRRNEVMVKISEP